MRIGYLNANNPQVRHPNSDGPLVLAAALLGRFPDRIDADDCDTVTGHRRLTLGPTKKASLRPGSR